MAPTKAYLEKAEHAERLLSLNPNMSTQDVSDATGISVTSVKRIKRMHSNGISVSGKPEQESTELDENALPVDFQESPQPIADEPTHESIVAHGKKLLRGMLGMPDETEKKVSSPQPVQAKLNTRQQTFVTNFSPIAAYGFILIAAWCWSKAGSEYVILQPTEDVAKKITEPLVRIYARHSSFVQSMSPDQIDAGQCIFALVAYVHASWTMYQQMKAEKEKEEEIEPRYQDGYGGIVTTEDRLNGRGYRRSTVQQNAPDATGRGANGRYEQPVNSDLTPKQEAERAALSRLSQLDFESRARRSGRFQ